MEAMVMNIENLRAGLKEYFQQYLVLFAYIFGSQVSRHTHPESDVDFAVYLRKSIGEEERRSILLSLLGVLSQACRTDDVDLVILNEAPPLLAFEVLRNGVLIYCSDDDARVEFQVRTLQAHEDTIPLRRILSEAMADRLRSGNFGKPVLRSVG